ncbi:MAG: FKBP-type peptidyl-prolyl cis-trans isomerase [Chloroflexi bacterium]|nr:FKBP-type peptidyl-prolyl cis-trans isomerase [Chloroflexota bacterium]
MNPRIAHVLCPGLTGTVLLIAALVVAVGCASPTPTPTPVPVAEAGDRAMVHYTGTLDDGTEFGTSRDGFPIDFIVGSGQMIEGFDTAVRGLAPGERVNVRLEAAEAYGEVVPELIVDVPVGDFPPELLAQLTVGMVLPISETIQAEVTAITDTVVTLDANDPLAGEALNFDIELVDLLKPTPTPDPAEDPAPAPAG